MENQPNETSKQEFYLGNYCPWYTAAVVVNNFGDQTLQEYKRVLERAYADTANPLRLAEECLLHREKRQGIDMVHDDVEKNLSREVDKIKNCQDKMRKMLEKAAIQLKYVNQYLELSELCL